MTRRRRSRKRISWIIILILLISAGIVCYLVWENYFKESAPVIEEETSIDIDREEDIEKNEPMEKKEEVIQYDGENPNETDELSGVVTYAGVAGDKLIIRVNIDQFLSGGSCKLRLVLEGDVEVYGDEADIIDSASTATCAGFDVPINGLSGKYDIYINLSSGGKVGTINGEVSL